jgi:long-subunit acyl-CoA synthetase (AMP-forming)
MTRSPINEINHRSPPVGPSITFARLDGSRSMPLTELWAAAGRLAAGLIDLGLTGRDRIGILASNCEEWVLLDLAALRIGVVTAGFEPAKFTADADLLDRYSLATVFTDRAFDAPGFRPIDEVTKLAATDGATEAVSYQPTDVTTIKFTSGSTGEPKGLGATVGSIDSSLNAVQAMFEHGPTDNLFCFLPLSLLQQRYWVYSALCFGHDVTISTYESAFVTMARSQPTVVMGVPAFFESAKKHIEVRARRAGTDDAQHQAAAALFGDRIRYLWTGSAPARAEVLAFFESLALPIYEGYGLNEACIVAKNGPGAHRVGSVGRVLAGKEVLLDEDGVVSVRCDYPVNDHYEYAGPGDSERMFGPGGVVRTGDLGYFDDDGFLYIRGRADDVIVLDNGKKVVVRPIEELMKASPAIDECVVLCPTQTHLVAVVSPASQPADRAAIDAQMALANRTLSADEQLRGVVVSGQPFTAANGLVSSQGKPRRAGILETYRTEIAAVATAPGSNQTGMGGQ